MPVVDAPADPGPGLGTNPGPGSGPVGSYGCVVLTQGRRPGALARAVASLLAQRGAGPLEVVVVGNGWQPRGLPPAVRILGLAGNAGIPAGRNAGVPAVTGDLLVFLDDDAELPDPYALARIAALFAGSPDLGMVQPQVADPAGLPPMRRWVPRLRVGDPGRSSDVCAVWEGCVVIRRALFDAVGGWPADFFYAHEGIDLAWKVWDAGFRVRYLGDVVVHHPAGGLDRHPYRHRLGARNRAWLARRHLPLPLAVAYLTTWSVLTAVRGRPAEVWQGLLGYRDGLTGPGGQRRPMRWRTVWRMTRAGRPPVI